LSYSTIKVGLDFAFAIFCLILISPLMGIFSLLIKLDTPGTVFYRGIRTGYHGKTFKIFKFRTMVMNAEKLGGGTTSLQDKRITRIGHFLRKTKLDEIPQLFNIVLGQMSFIGPRPELPQYTNLYNDEEKIILSVRPGITDLSSKYFVNLDEVVGSDDADLAYEQYVLKKKNQLRIKYVKKQSFLLDTYLFFSTLLVVSKKINRLVGS